MQSNMFNNQVQHVSVENGVGEWSPCRAEREKLDTAVLAHAQAQRASTKQAGRYSSVATVSHVVDPVPFSFVRGRRRPRDARLWWAESEGRAPRPHPSGCRSHRRAPNTERTR